jgi:hypothetical protein
MFVASLTLIFAKLIDTQLQTCLSTNPPATKQLPPYAIIADKMMSNRQTFQIVGIISFLSGCLVSFVVDLPVICGDLELDIRHTLLEPLKHHSLTVEDIRQQLVDGAMN